MNREQLPLPEDLKVFLTVARKQSFAAAAESLAQSPAYISKRIKILETTLKTKLLHRTTRKVTLTEDGVNTQRWAIQVLSDLDDLVNEISQARTTPKGLLNVCSTFGVGRNLVAPALSLLSEQYPELEIRLELFDRAVDIIQEGFDLEIRVGDDLPEQHICKKLASNKRVLCATPEYLQKHGTPLTLEDLENHDCLVIKERRTPYGIWTLTGNNETQVIKIDGPLSSNNGEIVVQWALNNRGIMLRSLWDVKSHLDDSTLVQVLPEYSQSANLWGVYPIRPSHSAKLRTCVEFLEQHFSKIIL